MGLSASLLPVGFGSFSGTPDSFVPSAGNISPSDAFSKGGIQEHSLGSLGFSSEVAIPTSQEIPVPIPPNERKTNFTPEAERILKLLSDGHSPEVVANTLGISASAVSQHLSGDSFRSELAHRKTEVLGKYKRLDDGYDRLESTLLQRAEMSAALLMRPGEIISMLSKVNAMKRRLGQSSNTDGNVPQSVVQITMPVVVVNRFTTTKENHVVAVNGKSLVTIPSHTLAKIASASPENITDAKIKEPADGSPSQLPAPFPLADIFPKKLLSSPVTKIRNPTILHRPVRTEVLENNAIRANVILSGILKNLEAREAIIAPREEYL